MKSADSHRQKTLSIVIPCYNEEAVIVETLDRLNRVAGKLNQIDIEYIFVDDGSSDRTRLLLKSAATHDPRIHLIGFSRNFGHQVAVSAGIDASQGDAVVLIDADLQDPPEAILNMVEKWQQGFDVVYGKREQRQGETLFKLATAGLFYRLLNRMSDIPIPLDTGDFRLMSRQVVEALKKMPERDRFIRGMVSWVGFRQTAISYSRDKRFAGESKYPLRKMLRFATDGLLSFSTKPLQISVAMGMLCSAISLCGIAYALFLRLFTDIWVEGWTALIIAILFMGGVQLISIGILGEYIGRIYHETKNRPLYLVEELVGFDQVTEADAHNSDSLTIHSQS